MRYSKFLLFIGFGLLLNGCQTNPYDMNDWQYDSTGAPQAQSAPEDIASVGRGGVGAQRQSAVVPQVHGDQVFQQQQRGGPFVQKQAQSMRTKVGILLPLSGTQEKLGQAMLKTAQMALFDVGLKNFELKPYDTRGTGEGARGAAKQAVEDNVQLILGPVFADSVRAAKNVVRYHNVNMIAFSTDWSVTSSNVFIMGFLPFDQIERIVKYAADNNMSRIAAIAPHTTYGRAIISAYQTYAQQYGIDTVDVLSFDPQNPQLKAGLRELSRYDARLEEANLLAETLKTTKNTAARKREVERIKAAMEAPYDAVLIAAGGETAVTISNMLSRFDLPPRKVKRLGIGLFDDTTLANEFALKNAWFSAPPVASRRAFDKRYKSFYGRNPPRLATLAYDATALAAVLAKNGMDMQGRPSFNRTAITNPNGFAGIDGIFRFLDNGTVERGLAVLSFDKNRIIEVDPASRTFQY